jgi:hypothetical protein
MIVLSSLEIGACGTDFKIHPTTGSRSRQMVTNGAGAQDEPFR